MHRLSTCLVLTVLSCFASVPAWAAGGAGKGKGEAKQLAAQGHTALKQKRWADAETALRRADELDPNLQTKLDLARALVGEGKLVDASKELHLVADDPGATAPAAKKSADAAKKELASIEGRIAWVQVAVRGPSAGKATVTIDGQAVDVSAEAPVDPGEHTVSAEADGFDKGEKRVTFADGAHEKVDLALARSAPEPVATDDSKPKDTATSKNGSIVPALVAFGVGAVGIGVGTVFGVMAFNEESKASAAKDTYTRTGSKQAAADFNAALSTSKSNGTVSTVAFIAGGVGVATGVVLLIVRPGGGTPSPKSDDAEKVSLKPWIGPAQAGVVGAF